MSPPIRESERARYPADWRAISLRIRTRAGNRCEVDGCSVPNGALIVRDRRDPFKWEFHSHSGTCCGEDCHSVVVVLTCAHLDHTPENCADDNLKAMCQRCHLTYDAKQHASVARATRERRSGQLRLEDQRPPVLDPLGVLERGVCAGAQSLHGHQAGENRARKGEAGK